MADENYVFQDVESDKKTNKSSVKDEVDSDEEDEE